MTSQYDPTGRLVARPAHEETMSEATQTLLRVLTNLLSAPRPNFSCEPSAAPRPMLTVAQTAALLGVSRMTVIRKADSGELPCVVISRGTKQKMRRFPRTPIENLALEGSYIVDV